MSEFDRTSDILDRRRKKAHFRSWHRGTREMDLVLGPFADAALESMTDSDLVDYEALLSESDVDLLKWVIGEAPVPVRFDTPVFRRVAAFRRAIRY